MKVVRPVSVSGTPPLSIPGELIVRNEYATFIPDVEPYGPHCLVLRSPEVCVWGADDDDSITITGLLDLDQTDPQGRPLFARVVMQQFYPVSREAGS